MSTGDVTNPKRLRTQANERVDDVDADALSRGPREHLDAFSRAIEVTPRNVGTTTPTGIIFQGFGLTLNPTGPSDGKARVQSALGVALDADGRLLIKENGVQVDVVVPGGTSQIYAYYIEDVSDSAVRRFIPVTPPFTPETPQSISTKFKGNVSFYVRTGDQTSIVANDVVNGATTALCFLGVLVNTAGAVTMSGYNATTAPNGAFATNRHTTVAVPTTLPPTNTSNGSIATMHGLSNAALYLIGQLAWKGVTDFTPAAANNFGAYTSPPNGTAAVARARHLALSSAVGSVVNTATRPQFGGDDGAVPSALYAYCVTPGAAFLRPGSTNRRVQIAPGMLLQSDGVNAAMLSYQFVGTEEFSDIANGAGGVQPRVDLLQMKITNDSVAGPSVLLQTKQGVTATTPVIPDPDAGFVPVGYVYVGPTYTGTSLTYDFGGPTQAGIIDLRMPLGVRSFIVEPQNFQINAGWSLIAGNIGVNATASTNDFYVRCPHRAGRVVGVDVDVRIASVPIGTVTLARGVFDTSLAGNVFSIAGFGTNTFNSIWRSRRFDFEQLYTQFPITPSSVNKIGVPLWTNGSSVPQDYLLGVQYTYFKMLNAPTNSKIGPIVWYVACGL